MEQIREDLKKHLPGWENAPSQAIIVEQMAGITNLTFKAHIEGSQLPPVIYRKFGESKKNLFLDRDDQAVIYSALAKLGVGPKIFYACERFRLEQFFQSEVLNGKNMLQPPYSDKVAMALADFHKLKEQHFQIEKDHLIKRTFFNRKEKMLEICISKLNEKIYTAQEETLVEILKKWVTAEEIDEVASIIKKYQNGPFVFSHNDLLANNVLFLKSNERVVFIDYQYGSFNFPFYDIANYFEESTIGYDIAEEPYFQLLPPRQDEQAMRARFIDFYNIALDYPKQQVKAKFEELRKEPKYVEKREKMEEDLVVGRMLCSLMWGWWAIIVSKNPLIKFDYLKFAKWRYDNYQECKKRLLK